MLNLLLEDFRGNDCLIICLIFAALNFIYYHNLNVFNPLDVHYLIFVITLRDFYDFLDQLIRKVIIIRVKYSNYCVGIFIHIVSTYLSHLIDVEYKI